MNDLIKNIEKLHTTEMGVERIKRNLSLEVDDVVRWCKIKILDLYAIIQIKGKNWYIHVQNYTIVVNAPSYNIITAHKK